MCPGCCRSAALHVKRGQHNTGHERPVDLACDSDHLTKMSSGKSSESSRPREVTEADQEAAVRKRHEVDGNH